MKIAMTVTEREMVSLALQGMDRANAHSSIEQDDDHAYGCFYNALKAVTTERYGAAVWELMADTWPWGDTTDGERWEECCKKAVLSVLHNGMPEWAR